MTRTSIGQCYPLDRCCKNTRASKQVCWFRHDDSAALAIPIVYNLDATRFAGADTLVRVHHRSHGKRVKLFAKFSTLELHVLVEQILLVKPTPQD